MAEKTLDNINRMARDFFQKAQVAVERKNLDYAIEMFQQCLAVEPNFLVGRKSLRAVQMKRAESGGGFKRMFTSAKSQPLMNVCSLPWATSLRIEEHTPAASTRTSTWWSLGWGTGTDSRRMASKPLPCRRIACIVFGI